MKRTQPPAWLCCEFWTLAHPRRRLARRWFTRLTDAVEWFKATFPSDYANTAELRAFPIGQHRPNLERTESHGT